MWRRRGTAVLLLSNPCKQRMGSKFLLWFSSGVGQGKALEARMKHSDNFAKRDRMTIHSHPFCFLCRTTNS